MRAALGQAAGAAARLLRAAVQLALALVLLAALGAGLAAWRLSIRPWDTPWLAHQIELQAQHSGSARIAIGGAALAWEGFHAGFDQPLDIRLTDVVLTTAAGERLASIPTVQVLLAPLQLLRGDMVPRRVTVTGADLRLIRQEDGSLLLDSPAAKAAPSVPAADPAAVLRALARPPASGGDGALWSQLALLGLRDSRFAIVDHRAGVTWAGHDLNMELRRAASGGLDGDLDATLDVGGQTAHLRLHGTVPADAAQTTLAAELSAVDPAKLAAAIPAAAALAALAAPVTLSATVRLNADWQPAEATARVEIGAGTLYAGNGQAPLQAMTLSAAGTAEHVSIKLERLDLQPRPPGPHTTLHGNIEVARTGGLYRASGAIDLDHIAFADLPLVWPAGTGGPGARPWIVQNIPEGQLHDGHVEFDLDATPDLSDITLARLAGGVAGEGVTIHWLRPVPPLEHASAKLTLLSPDSLAIDVTGARQAGGSQGGLQVQGGRVLMTGLAGQEQFADITAQVAGPVADLLTLLRHPRVKLLDRSPLKLTDASGQIAGTLTLSRLPLRDGITMDDVQLRTSSKLTDLHVAGLAAGRDVDDGALTLEANPAGLTVAGTAAVSGVPAQVTLAMDFRHGPPTQITQTVTARATLNERQLAAFGVDTHGMVTGPADLAATLTLRRNGYGEVALRGDLGKTALKLDRLSYAKPAGEAADLQAHVMLDGGRVTGIEQVQLDGPTLHVAGGLSFAGARPDTAHIARLTLGHDTDLHGEVHFPLTEGAPWVANLSGGSLNAAAEFAKTPPEAKPKPKSQTPGPPLRIDAAFDRVLLAEGRQVEGVTLHLQSNGLLTTQARISGRTDGKSAFRFAIEPRSGGRELTGSAADAGALLRALGVSEAVRDGKLIVAGGYDDTQADHKLTGHLHIDDFRLRNAPILARLLQAMTLYGLLEVVQGPGLRFTLLEAPFSLADDVLELHDARAYSPSLGMTAKGQIDLARQIVHVQGTIVPAYFFNSLLGNVPLVGQLFSPETGGGVFAATYGVDGKLDDPNTSVNPLAALTPGFLRRVFGIFDSAPQPPAK